MIPLLIGIFFTLSGIATLVLIAALRSSKPMLEAEPTLREVCVPLQTPVEPAGLADATASGPFVAPRHT